MTVRLLVIIALVAACSELPTITPGICGNGVKETLEDCDNKTVLCQDCGIRCGDQQQCPAGWTCGTDDTCHAPGGRFEQVTTSDTFAVLGYRIIDINDDNVGDVVGLGPASIVVRYGDTSGTLGDRANIVVPTVQGAPALTHLEDPLVDDLVIPVADGLVAYAGVLGLPSPRQFPLGSTGSMPGFEPLAAAQIGTTMGLFVPDPVAAQFLTLGVLTLVGGSAGFDAVTAQLCGGQIPIADWDTLDEVVSYHTPAATFLAFTPKTGKTCVLMIKKQTTPRNTGTCPLMPMAPPCDYQIESVTTQSFARLEEPPVFADLDGDGCPSVIGKDGGVMALVEYAGTPGGSAGCQLATTPVPLPPLPEPPLLSTLIAAVPLVPAPSNLKKEALVTTYGIYGLPTAGGSVPMYVSDRAMMRATIGDVNGDNEIDIVLTTDEPGVDLVRRVPNTSTFLRLREATTGPVIKSLIGDFDGDQRNDLAYVEQLGTAQRLSIAYGTIGGLLLGVPVGAFSGIDVMTTIQVKDSTDPFGVVDDLIVIDRRGSPEPEITILHGSPQRTMLSFYGPPVPNTTTRFGAVVAGNFWDLDPGDQKPDTFVDLFALQSAQGPETSVHVIPGLPNGRLGNPQYATGPMMNIAPTTTRIDDCFFASAEFCLGSSRFVAWPVSPTHDIVLGVDSRPTFDSTQLPPSLLRVDPTDTLLTLTIRNDVFPGGGRVNELDVADLDADGAPELIVSFSSTQGDPTKPRPHDGYTVVCKVTPDGMVQQCTDVAADILQKPELECVAAALGHVTPQCEVGQGAAGLRDLVVACHDDFKSEIYAIRGEGGTLVASSPIFTLGGARLVDVQLGDINGDKVDDLIVLDVGVATGIATMQVIPQLTTRERDVCSGL